MILRASKQGQFVKKCLSLWERPPARSASAIARSLKKGGEGFRFVRPREEHGRFGKPRDRILSKKQGGGE